MKTVKELVGKVIRFNKEIEKDELHFDEGMMVRVSNIAIHTYEDGDHVARIFVDFSEFEQKNKEHMRSSFWPIFSKDPKIAAYGHDLKHLLKWCDTTLYPKDCKDSFYLMEADVLAQKQFSIVDPAELNQADKEAQVTAETIKKLQDQVEFYKSRVDLLQQEQVRMREPERSMICDILANGCLLKEPNNERYVVKEQPCKR